MYDDYDDEPSLLLPLLLTLAIHGLVALGLMLGYKEKPKPKIIVMQASVIDAKTLNAQNSSGNLAKQQKSTVKPTEQTHAKKTKTTTPTLSDQISEYNERMAQRERVFQQQLADYANSMDRQIALDIERRKQAQKELDNARQREVDALRSRTKSNEEIARENLKSLNEASERLKNQEAQTQTTQNTKSTELDNSPAPSIPNINRGGQVGSTSNVSKSEAQANIAGRVQAKWMKHNNLKNRHLTATIRIDEQGNLVSVSFGAGDKDLQPSLEEAIREASPFPEMKGISTSFSIKFYTD
ncbi:cell envelope integrity protein TolA [Moraxella oblonga]|uniref:cell envelope integrity protein TolA n=1 Tax=Moraxella oblonga TaxID=200413 RepID=UPI00082A4D9E|nr:cell envelope integrity protein TolA [Moraxella oblonga]